MKVFRKTLEPCILSYCKRANSKFKIFVLNESCTEILRVVCNTGGCKLIHIVRVYDYGAIPILAIDTTNDIGGQFNIGILFEDIPKSWPLGSYLRFGDRKWFSSSK